MMMLVSMQKWSWKGSLLSILLILSAWIVINNMPKPSDDWPEYVLTGRETAYSGTVTQQDVDRGMSVIWVDNVPYRVQMGFWPNSERATGLADTRIIGSTVTKLPGMDSVFIEGLDGNGAAFYYLDTEHE